MLIFPIDCKLHKRCPRKGMQCICVHTLVETQYQFLFVHSWRKCHTQIGLCVCVYLVVHAQTHHTYNTHTHTLITVRVCVCYYGVFVHVLLSTHTHTHTHTSQFECDIYTKTCVFVCVLLSNKYHTVEPLYNEVLGTMKITLLYQVSHIRVKKTKKCKELGPAKLPRYKRILLYPTSL